MTISGLELNAKVNSISKLILKCIKDMASSGKPLTVEALSDCVLGSEEGRALLGEEKGTAANHDEKYSDIEIQNKFLVNENERIQKQKNKLLKQLDEIESKSYDVEKLYIRMLLFFVDVSKGKAGSEVDDEIKRFKKHLKKNESASQLENIFVDLKNNFIKSDLSNEITDSASGKSSFIGKFMKLKKNDDYQSRFVALIRESYQSIIDELGLDLGSNYLSKLLKIGKGLQTANDTNDFELLKHDIIELLHKYISDVCDERESTAKFIKDIGIRLIDVETNLLSALELSDQSMNSSGEFNRFIEEEMGDFKSHVNNSKSFEELKTAVTKKIEEIGDAISEKKMKDEDLKKISISNSHKLINGFNNMKTEAEKAKERIGRLEKELYIDPLTNALNRRAYTSKLNDEFQRYSRYKNKFSVLMFDVDHFKKINDTYGHATGDKCLVEIIKRVKTVIRKNDVLSRFGGEEFIVILPETTIEGAVGVAEKIRESIEKIEFLHKNELVKITVSVGVAQIEEADKNTEELFERMDSNLYQAKKSGRNRVVP